MNKKEKEKYIRDLTNAIKRSLIEKTAFMPKDWKEAEVTQYIGNYTSRICNMNKMSWDKKRMKHFENDCLVKMGL